MAVTYKRLDPDKIVETATKLHRRIRSRFPSAGLCKLADELREVAVQTAIRARWVRQPLISLRIVAGLVLVGLPILLLLLELSIQGQSSSGFGLGITTLAEFLQTLEASLGAIVFLGAAIFFVFSFEGRVKRGRALTAIHELRSMAHIVDMHQLTKDPERFVADYASTEESPQLGLTKFELERYLDYCSEMLSLISKVAALYVQDFNDPIAIQAVDEIETMTTSMSRKIWHKIMLIGRLPE